MFSFDFSIDQFLMLRLVNLENRLFSILKLRYTKRKRRSHSKATIGKREIVEMEFCENDSWIIRKLKEEILLVPITTLIISVIKCSMFSCSFLQSFKFQVISFFMLQI